MSRSLAQLFAGLEALYQTRSGLDPRELVRSHDGDIDGASELLVMREADDGDLEVALVFEDTVLAGFDADALVDDARLADALPVIEGLSHLCYLAEAVREQRPVSGLELETQAEVDKLAVTLLSRWDRAHEEFDRLVDRLYYRFELRGMSEDLRRRYHTANRVALSFSQRLRPHAKSRRLPALRSELRAFWRSSMSGKHALAG